MSVVNALIIIIFNVDILWGYLNIDELSLFQYEIDILNSPKRSADYLLENRNTVLLSSKYGQKYQCTIDHPIDDKKEEQSADLKSIVELLQPIEEGPCLQHNNGWWTYELCYKKFIRQFHQSDDKAIVGDIIYLGYYNSEFDWNATHQKEILKSYHSQSYINGTLCDLTKEPRRAEVRIRCRIDSSENVEDIIAVVEESLTCKYVISVESPRLCGHPQMQQRMVKENLGILCNPLLDAHQYEEYAQDMDDAQVNILKESDDEDDEDDAMDAAEIMKEDEMNLLTKIMVTIGKNIGTELTNKNGETQDQIDGDAAGSKHPISSSDYDSKPKVLIPNLDEVASEFDSEKVTISDGKAPGTGSQSPVAGEKDTNIVDNIFRAENFDENFVSSRDNDNEFNDNKKLFDSKLVSTDIQTTTMNQKTVITDANDNVGRTIASNGESISQDMDDFLDLDFDNVITQSINDILNEEDNLNPNNAIDLTNIMVKEDFELKSKSSESKNDQTTNSMTNNLNLNQNEELYQDISLTNKNNIKSDDNKDYRNTIDVNKLSDIVIVETNGNTYSVSTSAQDASQDDREKVKIDGSQNDVNEKKHFSFEDLKDGKIQWEAGNNANQEIYISSHSDKKKLEKKGRKNKYEVTFLPFTVNVMNINSGEKSLFAVVTRNTIEEHRSKRRMKRIEDNYQFRWKSNENRNYPNND